MKNEASATEVVCRLPVIVQALPNLRYEDGDWISKQERLIAIGSIPIRVLTSLFEVDQAKADNPEGYQRVATPNRVNTLRRDLESCRVDLPTALLLNLREFDESVHLNRQLDYSTLTLHQGNHLYVVDGQHRAEALIGLNKEEPQRWGDYSIPFVCLLGADRNGEMTEFYVVNSNAKSIGTGLAYELLKRRADHSEIAKDHLIETGKAWVQAAETLTQKLTLVDSWRDRIQFPGQKKSGTLITNNGMATSLRPLVEQPGFFQAIRDVDQQVQVLNAYWEGIRLVLPAAMRDPEQYNLQRSLGVTALHPVLVNMLAIMVSNGLSVRSPEDFAEVLETPLKTLGGQNQDGEEIQGADFWRRGAAGASAMYNNRVGHRVLQARIREKLPHVNVR